MNLNDELFFNLKFITHHSKHYHGFDIHENNKR